jgi:tight adherence protein C
VSASTTVLGFGAGLGVIAIAAGLQRDRPTRGMVLAGLASTGSLLMRTVRLTSPASSVRQDLAILGRSEESLAVATALAAVLGLTIPALACAGAGTLGVHIPTPLVPLVCLLVSCAGAAMPSLIVRQSAKSARLDLVHSLACWLELVALAQAGGMGVESALGTASAVVGEASFLRIRHALDRARHAGRSPWDGLGRLGSELGVDELEELAASIRLAGTEGARIRSSLSAKSASLRRRQMAEAQRRAKATTERLFLPAMVLMVGFVVFLIYPAGVTLSRIL